MRAACRFAPSRCWGWRKENFRRPNAKPCCCVKPIGRCCAIEAWRSSRRLRGDEVTFFYQAITRATDRLLLTRPYLAADGQPWEPSPYWSQVLQLFDQPIVRKVRPEDHLAPEEAASAIEWVQAAQQFDRHLQRGLDILRARLTESAANLMAHWRNCRRQLRQRYSPAHGWSASRLEMYGTCPFAFYIAHALQLEPRTPPEEGYDARMLGSMLHKILENVYQHEDPLSALPYCGA